MNRRQAIYEFIVAEVKRRRIAPTYEEIMKGLSLSSKNLVAFHVEALIKEGRLKRDEAKGPRSLIPLPEQIEIAL